ncbi:MAG: helicase-related protein [Polyangiales bacterium]
MRSTRPRFCALYVRLKGHPVLNAVLKHTATEALALDALAERVFPASPKARRATEVLLTLGALARPAPEEQGLLPTRVHLMFRGLSGLYGCLNATCSGRQASPALEAPVGKLFAEPRAHCDACGSRVFELASCRECGAVYFLAWTYLSPKSPIDFLWTEATGDLVQVQLLAERPREVETDGRVVELEVQRATGAVVQGTSTLPRKELRTLWAAYDHETGAIAGSFRQCPMCQPPGGRRQTRVLDFRTRGEQSFTALIEAQFAEQPPQKRDPSLPNQGRKVLVFSDGRQKAARLAPALETNHAADAFRQVLAMAVHSLRSLGSPGYMHQLYPAVLDVCARRGINLIPNEESPDVFAQHVQASQGRTLPALINAFNAGMLPPPTPYADALFREFTDRFFSLSAIGLGTVGPSPLVGMAHGFPDVGLSAAEIDILLRHWIRVQLEARRFLLTGFTRDRVGEDWERPDAIDPSKLTDLLPRRFQAWLVEVLGEEKTARVQAWFQAMPQRLSSHFWALNGGLYLTPQMLTLELRTGADTSCLRCTSCNRLYAASLKNQCSECTGTLEPVSTDPTYLDARSGYYRDQVLRALHGDGIEPFGLVTAEHSAQLSGVERKDAFTKTERYELRFQDIRIDGKAPVDVLSCTTTMEVGIDIGALCGVALRNVPPHVANYQQRAGRAGRRGRSIASVITFAQGGTHDAYYFDNPGEMISGGVRTPIVYVENQVVLARHINAFLVQRYFHEAVATNLKLFRLFESLGTVGTFFDGTESCSYAGLRAWLKSNRTVLEGELRAWVPAFSHGLTAPIDVEATIAEAIDRLLARIANEFPIPAILGQVPLGDEEREGIARLRDDNLLEAFINRAIFPRYAFPTDTVTFWVRERNAKGKSWKPDFEYLPQRDLSIALTEYAPTRQLTIDKLRFRSAALYDFYGRTPNEMIQRARPYVVCGSCAYMSLREEDADLLRCPVCASESLRRLPFVRPEGFAPDINEPLKPDRGGSVSLVGQSSPAQLQVELRNRWDETLFDGRLRIAHELKDLVVVNSGIDDRGFMICPSCGRSEPVYGRRFTTPSLFDTKGRPKAHLHPIEAGVTCKSVGQGPYFLGHSFRTDVLLLRVKVDAPLTCDPSGSAGGAARAALTSLVEALCLAATRSLQIDDGELAGNWSPVLGGHGDEADLYLYDVLPGGPGTPATCVATSPRSCAWPRSPSRSVPARGSCYRCLRHYANARLHPQLDWRLAKALLGHIRRGDVPSVDDTVRGLALDQLDALLRLREVPFTRDVSPPTAPTLTVPMIVGEGPSANWIDVHHPLVDCRLNLRGRRDGRRARAPRGAPGRVDPYPRPPDGLRPRAERG